MKLRTAILPLLLIPTAAQSQVLLRLNLQAGRTHTYVTDMSMDQPMVGTMKIRTVQDFKVTKKVADRQTINMLTRDMKVTVPKGSPMEASVKQMEKEAKGASMTATYTSRGVLVGKVTAKGNVAATRNAAAMGAFNYGFMGLDYPSGPIKPGYSWTLRVDVAKMAQAMGQGTLPPGMKVAGKPMLVRYTLKGFGTQRGKRVAKVSYTMKGALTMSMPAQGQTPMNLSVDIAGTGAAAIDTTTGLPFTNSATLSMNVTKPMVVNQKMKFSMTLK